MRYVAVITASLRKNFGTFIERRKTEETDHSRRIRWKNVKTGRKRWSEWRKRGAGGRSVGDRPSAPVGDLIHPAQAQRSDSASKRQNAVWLM